VFFSPEMKLKQTLHYMRTLILLLSGSILLLACTSKRNTDEVGQSLSTMKLVNEISESDPSQLVTVDTLVTIGAETYQLIFTANLNQLDEADYNASFTIQNSKDGRVLLMDSLVSSGPQISLGDFNGDKIPDIWLYRESGARANEYGYLYVTGPDKDQFTSIKGFEYLCNAQVDANNIITSLCLSGVNTYTFLRINAKNELEQLGESWVTDGRKQTEEKVMLAYQQLLGKQGGRSLLDSLAQICPLHTTDTFNMESCQTDDFSRMIPVTKKLYQTIFPDLHNYSANTFFIYACLPRQHDFLTLIIYQRNFESENHRVDYMDLVNIDKTGKCLDKIRLAAKDNEVITYEVSSSLHQDTLTVTEQISSEPYFDPPRDTLYTNQYVFKINGRKGIDTLRINRFFEVREN